MSMQIEALAWLEQRALQAQETAGLSVPVRLLPKDVSAHSLEKFQAHRARFRGAFSTSAIADFVRYAGKYSGGSCFIDQEKMSARAIFDLGDLQQPGHGDHRATLTLQRTAPFTALLQIEGKQTEQKSLAEWMEDWKDYLIAFTADGEAIDAKKAVAAIRRITIAAAKEVTSTQDDFKGTRSALEQVEARSDNGLPAGFRFICTPFHGLDQRSFELRLGVITSDTPKLVLRGVRFEEARELMAQEFADKLDTGLKSGGADADVYVGTFEVGV